MKWSSLFTEVPNMSGDQVRDLLETKPRDGYQFVDVRQPAEYSQDHIPGAILIPLKELPGRIDELSPHKKTIVYCRSGARSKAGAQLLADNGFTDVVNMAGGMLNWQGFRAAGGEALGIELFLDGDFASAFSMAMAMERGLQQFYQQLADTTTDPPCRELLLFMAHLEDGHMAKLAAIYGDVLPGSEGKPDATIGEGGLALDDILKRLEKDVSSIEDAIQLGMMFESQAYDLYTRLERKEMEPNRKHFFGEMAREEQSHLARLTKELEKRII